MIPSGTEPVAFRLVAVPQPTAQLFAHKIFGPFHDVTTEFNCTSATYSEICPLSANEVTKKRMRLAFDAPNSTQAA
jgi:hypothetical protein